MGRTEAAVMGLEDPWDVREQFEQKRLEEELRGCNWIEYASRSYCHTCAGVRASCFGGWSLVGSVAAQGRASFASVSSKPAGPLTRSEKVVGEEVG